MKLIMILSDQDIRQAIEAGVIKIDPYPDFEQQLGPSSLDFHLGNEFKLFDTTSHPYIDPRQKDLLDNLHRTVMVEDDHPFIVHPGELILAAVTEWMILPNDLIGRLEGRSSLARLGVVVHSTAARFDPGWDGRPVLELGNLGRMPVALYPGMRICSFTFEKLSSPSLRAYGKDPRSKYAQQAGVIGSQLGKELK